MKESILKALSTVIDPDFGKDVVSLNMIRNIEVEGNEIAFDFVLTTPACPLKERFRMQCDEAIKNELGSNYTAKVNFKSEVTTARNNNLNILPNVSNIICVASGKGGVGKSTVSVNLALSLAAAGAKVGLIDADIHGPSVPLMLGLKGQKPEVREIKGKHYILPIESHGIKSLSIGLLVDERQAVVWRGPMVASALRQFVTDCIWGNLDYLIMDMPPGTGDVHLTMVQTVPVTAAVIVTTPQEVALADARKAVAMFRMPKINVPVVGIIENMSHFETPELPGRKFHIFGEGGGEKLANEYETAYLGGIPIMENLRERSDLGVPSTTDQQGNPTITAHFDKIASSVAQQIAKRNAQQAPTKIVEVATS